MYFPLKTCLYLEYLYIQNFTFLLWKNDLDLIFPFSRILAIHLYALVSVVWSLVKLSVSSNSVSFFVWFSFQLPLFLFLFFSLQLHAMVCLFFELRFFFTYPLILGLPKCIPRFCKGAWILFSKCDDCISFQQLCFEGIFLHLRREILVGW